VNSDGNRISSRRIAELLYSQADLDQFQLVEKRNGLLELTLVAGSGSEIETSKYTQLLRELFGKYRKLRLRSARTIIPESSGKFRWVKAMSQKNLKC
jgi:hypothetical protein